MKEILIIAFSCALLSGCSTWHNRPYAVNPPVVMRDVQALNTDDLIQCSLTHSIGSKPDSFGLCEQAVQAGLSLKKINQDDINRNMQIVEHNQDIQQRVNAENAELEMKQQAINAYQSEQESNRLNSTINTIAVQNAICSSSYWGC